MDMERQQKEEELKVFIETFRKLDKRVAKFVMSDGFDNLMDCIEEFYIQRSKEALEGENALTIDFTEKGVVDKLVKRRNEFEGMEFLFIQLKRMKELISSHEDFVL